MFNALKEITTYDFLGFLVPGMVLMLALLAFSGLVTQSEISLSVSFADETSTGWFVFLLVSYVLGSLAQGIGNKVFGEWGTTALASWELDKARDLLVERGIVTEKKLDEGPVCDYCDQYMLRNGNEHYVNLRDMYTYREGFYRGMTVALAGWVVVGAAMLAILAATQLPLFWISTSLNTSGAFVLGGALLFIAGMILSYQRYRRFKDYRQKHAVRSFLVATAPEQGEKPQGLRSAQPS